ncbi:hypothetical protein J3F84DRAFT_188978 [Trichoderma pleuroticola]
MRKSSFTAGYQWPGPNIDRRPALEQLGVPCRHPQRGKDRTGCLPPRAHDHDEKIARAPRLTGKAPAYGRRWRYSGPGSMYLLAQVVVALRALRRLEPLRTPPHILVHVRIVRVLVRAFNPKADNAKSEHGEGGELELERGALGRRRYPSVSPQRRSPARSFTYCFLSRPTSGGRHSCPLPCLPPMGAMCALPWATWLRLCGDLDLPYRVRPRTCTLRLEAVPMTQRILPSFLPSHTSTLIVVPGRVPSRWQTKRVTNSGHVPPRPHRRCPITLLRNGARSAWLVQKEKRSHDVSSGVTRTSVHLKRTVIVLVGRGHDLCRKSHVSCN